MTYLLDVNALIAFGHIGHQFNDRMEIWVASISATDQLATTPITELGFVRIMAQVYKIPIAQSKQTLASLQQHKGLNFTFIADDSPASKLPSWITNAKHTTDGHLLELAISHNCVLATFDTGIAGAFVIP